MKGEEKDLMKEEEKDAGNEWIEKVEEKERENRVKRKSKGKNKKEEGKGIGKVEEKD